MNILPFHYPSGWVVKGFGMIDVNCQIDYAFEPEDWVDGQGPVDFGPYAEKNLQTVHWKGHMVKVTPLELHLRSNIARNRMERVKSIKAFLQK